MAFTFTVSERYLTQSLDLTATPQAVFTNASTYTRSSLVAAVTAEEISGSGYARPSLTVQSNAINADGYGVLVYATFTITASGGNITYDRLALLADSDWVGWYDTGSTTITDGNSKTYALTFARGESGVSLTGADGESAYTVTTADFTQPAAAATVAVTVENTGWLVPGCIVFFSDGTNQSYYEVTVVGGATSLTLENTGTTGNATAGATMVTGGKFVPAGAEGPAGAPGAPGADAVLETFTGAPSAYTPSASGAIAVRTDTTPDLPYRTTGTGAGDLTLIGSYLTFTGDPSLVSPDSVDSGILYIATDTNRLYRNSGGTLVSLSAVASAGGTDMTYTLTNSVTPASGEIKLSSVDTSDFGTAGGGFGDTIRISETDADGVAVADVLSTVVQASYVKIAGQTSGAICYARVFSAVDSGTYRTWGVNLLTKGTGIFSPGETVSVQLLPGTLPINTSKTANFSPGLNSERFFVDVSGGSVTATLPDTGGGPNYDDSLHYLFKVLPGSSSNTLTLARSGSDTIDGDTSVVLYEGESITIHSDGQGSWYIT